jgi:hypothetical protein
MKHQTYHMVIGVEDDGSDLRSSKLYINDIKGAQDEFKKLIKELSPSVKEKTLEYALDEGWYTYNGASVLIIDPVVVIKKN